MLPYNGCQHIVTYLYGNDEADELVKEGSKMKQVKKALYNTRKSRVSTAVESNIKKA
jgi:hypothetical protein